MTPETIINCNHGALRLPAAWSTRRTADTALSIADVLAKSSNIGAIQIATSHGRGEPVRLCKAVRVRAESRGFRCPAESARTGSSAEEMGIQPHSLGGDGARISVTAIQLAQACSVVANGGMLVKPRLVIERQRPGDEPEIVGADGQTRSACCSPETAITMRQMMEGVVLHGTGKTARLNGYTSGGKTGTAQIYDFDDRAYTHKYNGVVHGICAAERIRRS